MVTKKNFEFVVENEPEKQGIVEKNWTFSSFPPAKSEVKSGQPWEEKWKLEAKNEFPLGRYSAKLFLPSLKTLMLY